MKALVYHGPHDIRYDEFRDPAIKQSGDVIVKIDTCGICGSDLHIYHGHGASRSIGYCVGHEAVGEIVEVGSAVNKLRPGSKVMLPASLGCGNCPACLAGDPVLCVNGKWACYGLGPSLQGCQAEAVRVPMGDFNAQLIPEGLSLDQALLLTDNLPTAYTACKDADIKPGAAVGVVGVGPIGLIAVELAIAMGAGIVYAIDMVAERRALAEQLGAVGLAPDNAKEIIRDQTKGRMLNSVVEAVGFDATVTLAIDLAGRRGTVSCLGFNQASAFPFPLGAAFVKGITFRTGMAVVGSYNQEIVGLLRTGRIRPEKTITHRLSLSEGPQAYRMFANKEDGALKVFLTP